MDDTLAFLARLISIFVAIFLAVVGVQAMTCLNQIRDDIRITKSLIAAFMEHKVAPTVAENRLATLVQEANKPFKT